MQKSQKLSLFLNIISISMYLWSWMNASIYFICVDFAELWGMLTWSENSKLKYCIHQDSNQQPSASKAGALGSVPVETYSRNSIFIIGSVWPWNWYCTHINLNNVILWGIIPICKIFAKTWHCLFCFGVRYSFWPFALTRECALHLRPCEKTPETYFAGGLAGFSKTIRTVPE